MTAMTPPSAATPRHTYTQSSLDMRRTLPGSKLARYLPIALLLMLGCAETKEYAKAGGHAVIDCAKADLPAIAALLADWGARAALAGKVDWANVEDGAKHKGLAVGSCAVATFIAAIRKQPEPQVAASGEVLDVVVQGQAVLARVSGGAEVRLP